MSPTKRSANSEVAQRLLDAATGWARELGFARVSLAVTTNNPRARRLYERFGFVATGHTWPLQHTPALSLHEMQRAL